MLFWDFITARCDHAGVWKPNKNDFETKTKFRVNLDSFFLKVNGDKQRILLLENGRWFIPGFISYQWFNKKETFDLVLSNRLHQSIYDILIKNCISSKKVRGLKEVLKTPKDKDKVIEEGEKGLGKGEGFLISTLPMSTELTAIEIGSTKEYISIVRQKNLTDHEIKNYWKAFKINNFSKEKWYNSYQELLSHFRDSLKFEVGNSNGKEKITEKSNSAPLRNASDYV